MQREGSALTGLKVVFVKELEDYTGSVRMLILIALILLTAVASLYGAAQTIRSVVGEDPFLLLSLFSISKEPIPSFASFLGFLVPLVGIALGFDVVNAEFQKRTLGRILSQPIYRDALLFGKLLGALAALGIVLLALWLLVIGSAMLFLGIPPSGEQVARAISFYLVTLFYGAIWFVLAMLFSVLFRQPATSALVSISLWLLVTVFWPMIVGVLVRAFGGLSPLDLVRLQQGLARLSPNTLFGEAALVLLNPSTRNLGPVVFTQLEGAVMGAPLPFGQSLLLIWPHLTALAAAVILIFSLAYVRFQRQEIRA
ncbi:MAG TPA: ABC transporter permease [Sediminispirochaeta sp.]|nr:ABC transporter permease [Sediminispirochaeta sp.]